MLAVHHEPVQDCIHCCEGVPLTRYAVVNVYDPSDDRMKVMRVRADLLADLLDERIREIEAYFSHGNGD